MIRLSLLNQQVDQNQEKTKIGMKINVYFCIKEFLFLVFINNQLTKFNISIYLSIYILNGTTN